jgi:Mrp family chromosome partitioning ATPase
VNHPGDLLSSERMETLLTQLAKNYDLVVIDSPPLMAVSDALVLARLAEKTVFLVQWAKTPQEVAERGLRLLIEAGADVAGTVLSMANLAKMATHDPGANYYKKVHRYTPL